MIFDDVVRSVSKSLLGAHVQTAEFGVLCRSNFLGRMSRYIEPVVLPAVTCCVRLTTAR